MIDETRYILYALVVLDQQHQQNNILVYDLGYCNNSFKYVGNIANYDLSSVFKSFTSRDI